MGLLQLVSDLKRYQLDVQIGGQLATMTASFPIATDGRLTQLLQLQPLLLNVKSTFLPLAQLLGHGVPDLSKEILDSMRNFSQSQQPLPRKQQL